MNPPPDRSEAMAERRRRAEAQWNHLRAGKALRTELEMSRLVHELEVHQIELEMQNEELRQAQQQLEASKSKYFAL